jgi:hypothetical protein
VKHNHEDAGFWARYGQRFDDQMILAVSPDQIAACHQMDFLLTWNCTHINNAQIVAKVEALCEQAGYRCPIICTPQELM